MDLPQCGKTRNSHGAKKFHGKLGRLEKLKKAPEKPSEPRYELSRPFLVSSAFPKSAARVPDECNTAFPAGQDGIDVGTKFALQLSSSGGPKGARNGNFKHGIWSRESVDFRKTMGAKVRELRGLLRAGRGFKNSSLPAEPERSRL